MTKEQIIGQLGLLGATSNTRPTSGVDNTFYLLGDITFVLSTKYVVKGGPGYTSEDSSFEDCTLEFLSEKPIPAEAPKPEVPSSFRPSDFNALTTGEKRLGVRLEDATKEQESQIRHINTISSLPPGFLVEPTVGEKRFRIVYGCNPGDLVQETKEKFARLMDGFLALNREDLRCSSICCEYLETACMYAVKALTQEQAKEGIECARELLPKYRLELLLDIFKDVPFEESLAEIVNLGKVLVGRELTKKWKEAI